MIKKAVNKKSKKNVLLSVCIAFVILLLGIICFTLYHSLATFQRSTTYGGILPCADCSGLATTLTIIRPFPFTDKGIYILHEFYEGKSIHPIVTQGQWSMAKGMPNDPQAIILILNPQNEQTITYYWMVDKDTLEPLDPNKQIIDSPFDQKLRVIKTPRYNLNNSSSGKRAIP
jgi:copper homeostasis protein (lipoprotein)